MTLSQGRQKFSTSPSLKSTSRCLESLPPDHLSEFTGVGVFPRKIRDRDMRTRYLIFFLCLLFIILQINTRSELEGRGHERLSVTLNRPWLHSRHHTRQLFRCFFRVEATGRITISQKTHNNVSKPRDDMTILNLILRSSCCAAIGCEDELVAICIFGGQISSS